MLYQRRSTTFELMNMDEGSGSAGAITAPSMKESEDGTERIRKSSCRHRNPTDSSNGESELMLEHQRRSGSGDTTLSQKRFLKRYSGESTASCKKNQQVHPKNFSMRNKQHGTETDSPDIQRRSSYQEYYQNIRPYDYYDSNEEQSPSTSRRDYQPDPATMTSISEMIADDCDNEDDDSFAIFCIDQNQPYLNRNYHYPQKHRNFGKIQEKDEFANNNMEEEMERQSCSSRQSLIEDELDELEKYEINDQLGEMMPKGFGRRTRREGVVSMGQKWMDDEYLSPSHANQTISLTSVSDNQSKCSDENLEENNGMKKYAKLILPHVGLVVITCAYTLIGASIFYSVENPNEIATKRRQLNMIYARQTEFVSSLIRLAASNQTYSPDSWSELARLHMHEMSDQLFLAFDKYFLTSYEVKRNTTKEIWTFSTALFFSVTVVTTIGYGNPVPVTQFGRMMCISFSLFGIPLTLVTIADMGKFLSERLIWIYGKYLRLKHFLCMRVVSAHKCRISGKERRELVCDECHSRGLSDQMQVIEEQRCWSDYFLVGIPALLVFGILVLYTALGGILMMYLEPWSFFTSFYWSFITMTTVGFGDLMPRRDQYMYLILLYIILGLAITTMCIDLVGVQYIRKIHYFGRKIQDARSALAIVGGKVVLVSELYANLMQKRARDSQRDAFVIENLYVSKHIIPFIPSDIRYIRYIDQPESHRHRYHQSTDCLSDISTMSTVSSLQELSSCRFCQSRFSISKNHR